MKNKNSESYLIPCLCWFDHLMSLSRSISAAFCRTAGPSDRPDPPADEFTSSVTRTMNFFDGDPRRRRDVNLGGASRSKTASRTAVVDDTRAQRAQRELEQRQHRSARKIQVGGIKGPNSLQTRV